MELFERIKKVIETFYDGKSSHLAAVVGVPANSFNRHIAENYQNKISLNLIFQILEKTPDVNRDWLFFGEGEMIKAQPEPAENAPKQIETVQPVQQDITDPISQRILITTQALEKAGAPQEKIQDAIMAILKPGTTYSTGNSSNNSFKEAAEPHTEYGEGKKQVS